MEKDFEYVVYSTIGRDDDEESKTANVFFDEVGKASLEHLLETGADLIAKWDALLLLWDAEGQDDEVLCADLMRKTLTYLNGSVFLCRQSGLTQYIHIQTYKVLLRLHRVADCEKYIGEHQQWMKSIAIFIVNHFEDEAVCDKGLYFEELFD